MFILFSEYLIYFYKIIPSLSVSPGFLIDFFANIMYNFNITNIYFDILITYLIILYHIIYF